MKMEHHTFVLLAVLLLAGMIISPVFAAEYTLTGYQEFNVFDVKKDMFDNVRNLSFDKSTEDQAITLIHFKVPQDHTVEFIIWYGAGNSVSGSASVIGNFTLWPFHTSTSTIIFDGIEKSYSYLDTNPEFDYYLSGYARANDETNQTGIIVYNAGYGGFDNDLAVFKPVDNLAGNLIYRVDLSCDAEFDVDITYGTSSQVAASVSKSIIDIAWDWMNYAIDLSLFVFALVVGLFAWLKFFFVDNLLMTVSLYLAITMAYSACTSRNIFQFFRKFFNDQRKLFEFIIGLWRVLIEIISSFRAIFRI